MQPTSPNNAPLDSTFFEISTDIQSQNAKLPQPPRQNVLNRFSQCVVDTLGHKYTKVLAGLLFISGFAAIPFIGPGAIAIFIASGVLFCASTTTSVLNKNPDESLYDHLEKSVYYFGLPSVISLTSPALLGAGIGLFFAYCCLRFANQNPAKLNSQICEFLFLTSPEIR